MRKIIIIAALALLSLDVQSQSLMDMFKAATSPTPTQTKPAPPAPKLTHKDVLGEWNFSKLAVGLSDDSSLKGAFGNMAISQVENLLNVVSSSNGISENMFSLTLMKNDIATIKFQSGAKANSPYALDIEHKSIRVEVGKLDDIEVGTLTAKITMNSETEMSLLVDAKELIAVSDQIPSIAENGQYQMVKSVVNSLDGIMLGFFVKREMR